MYVVTGATGKVGGATARALLEHRLPVRVIVRDADMGKHWKSRGADVAIAAFDDEQGLTAAFEGASGVFLMLPPISLLCFLLISPGWMKTDLGGQDATLEIDESIPRVVDQIEAVAGATGLHCVDYKGDTLPW
jgi:NAD(P)-dependent dehydrogenase (short-subunit alcohol dehydrogenase family)